jgi:3-methyladenine DNA glycosylase AlkD
MTITNSHHLELSQLINKSKSGCKPTDVVWVQKYLGSNKTFHGFSSLQMSLLVKTFLEDNKLSESQSLELLNSLYQNGTTYTEIALAAMILTLTPLIKSFDPKNLDLWLNYTCGWAENDVLCQSNFSSDILLSNWENWQKWLKKFNQDKNINKRRASLVLLTKPLRQSNDLRLSKIAFENIENLKLEKEILITKAVSWALRALVKFHKDDVLIYLEKNKDTLPKIAYREAFSKALTGKKYVNKSKKQVII